MPPLSPALISLYDAVPPPVHSNTFPPPFPVKQLADCDEYTSTPATHLFVGPAPVPLVQTSKLYVFVVPPPHPDPLHTDPSEQNSNLPVPRAEDPDSQVKDELRPQ